MFPDTVREWVNNTAGRMRFVRETNPAHAMQIFETAMGALHLFNYLGNLNMPGRETEHATVMNEYIEMLKSACPVGIA